ncbi:hypothetical protein B0H17DRAFT_1151082 [Mycena rosella]|uniref:Uncharacterized protein n=1 Tax=Mycena rosella TaxID=1033263 RepID=A0AAD7FIV4_MYCRO|nr:hypothetical protein B0H17DRAFT_1151082 [Mycena rosella]
MFMTCGIAKGMGKTRQASSTWMGELLTSFKQDNLRYASVPSSPIAPMQYYPLLRPTAPSARSKLALRNLAQGQEDVRGGHPSKYTPNTTGKILVFQALLEVHGVAQQSEAAHQAERRPMGIGSSRGYSTSVACEYKRGHAAEDAPVKLIASAALLQSDPSNQIGQVRSLASRVVGARNCPDFYQDHPDNEPSTASCTDQCNVLLLAEIDQEFFRDSTPYRVRQDPVRSESMLAIMSLRADHITGSREDDDEYNKIQLRDYLLYTCDIYS